VDHLVGAGAARDLLFASLDTTAIVRAPSPFAT